MSVSDLQRLLTIDDTRDPRPPRKPVCSCGRPIMRGRVCPHVLGADEKENER